MKIRLLAITLLLCSSFGVAAAANADEKMTVNVPHEFVVNGVLMPAGSYVVSRLSDTFSNVLVIRSRQGSSQMLVLPRSFDEKGLSQFKLSFETSGDQYILSKISTSRGVYKVWTAKNPTQIARRQAATQSAGN